MLPLPDRPDLPELIHKGDGPYVAVDHRGRFLYAVFPQWADEHLHVSATDLRCLYLMLTTIQNALYANTMAYGNIGNLKPCHDKKKKKAKRAAKKAVGKQSVSVSRQVASVSRVTTRFATRAAASSGPTPLQDQVVDPPVTDESEYIYTEDSCLKGSRHLAIWHQQGHAVHLHSHCKFATKNTSGW